MKRTAAILLMGLLLFNWIGYRVLIAYMQDKAGSQLDEQLDNDKYDESELLLIKVPALHLSSYSLSGQFQRTNGYIDVKGIQYQYVKKRIFNDSLEYVCIANQQGMKLEHAKDEIFKQLNDLKHNGQEKKSDAHHPGFKNFTSEYFSLHDLFTINRISSVPLQNRPSYLTSLATAFLAIAEQPPECTA